MVGRRERGRQGEEQQQQQQHAFSIELKSKDHLKSISLGNENNNNHVVIEGLLGKLLDLKLIEDSMLQFIGANGTLRLDVSGKDMRMRLKETQKSQGRRRRWRSVSRTLANLARTKINRTALEGGRIGWTIFGVVVAILVLGIYAMSQNYSFRPPKKE